AGDCVDNNFRKAEKNHAYRLEKADPRNDIELAWEQLEITRAKLSDSGSSAPKNYAIVLFDAYLLDVVGDMLTFLHGTRTKADFLTRIASGYPNSNELTQPGIINLYYQLSDAKLFSDTPWPLDQMIGELNRARDGSMYFISESKKKVRQDPGLEADKRK